MPMNRENNYKIVEIDLSDDTQVNSGGSENIQTLQPGKGFVYELMAVYYAAPAPVGDSSGTHDIQIGIWNGTSLTNMSQCKGNHSTTIYTKGCYHVGDSLEIPASQSDQIYLLTGGLKASNSHPLRFVYSNDTDANQTGTRTCRIICKKYREAS